MAHAPRYLLAILELFFLCHLWEAGGLLPLGLVVGLPCCLWICLPLGLLVMSPAHLPLTCRSLEELIPPRAYLCLVLGAGHHSVLGLAPSLGVEVLGVAVFNHVPQRPVRVGTGLVPIGGSVICKTLRGSSLLRL